MKKTVRKIKEKLWLWRPIVFFTVVGTIVFVFVSDEINSTDLVNALRRSKPISKIEMRIFSDAGVNNTILTDRKLLDSINNAFRFAREKNIVLAKAFDIKAGVNVYKENQVINLSIKHSVYSGWTIEVGNKILTNNYLFTIVKRYAK